jgi:signal transduction histidine kinase
MAMEGPRSTGEWLAALPPPVADALVAGGLLLVALPDVPRPWDHHPSTSWPVIGGIAVLVLAQSLPHLLRRRWPLAVVAATAAVLAVRLHFALDPSSATFSLAAAFWAVAAFGGRRTRVVGGAVAAAFAVLGLLGERGLFFPAAVFVVALPAQAGLRRRSAHLAELEARAASLEAARRQAVATADDERGRIARELHDVVAHHVSVMVVQADAAQCVLESEPGQADAALTSIAGVGREALTELRRLLGVLRAERPDGGDPSRAPRPGLRRLDDLVAQVRAAGLRVELVTSGRPRPLPAGIDLSAYRIVQEALTNALKHAGRASVRVAVRYGDDQLEVEVSDDGAGVAAPATDQAPRYGLVGMRERVAVFGGDLAAGPRAEGGFAVRVRLPLAIAPESA